MGIRQAEAVDLGQIIVLPSWANKAKIEGGSWFERRGSLRPESIRSELVPGDILIA